MGEDHPLGLSGGSTGGHHQGIAVDHRKPVGSGVGPVQVDHRRRPEPVEELVDRGSGEAGIQGEHRIALVPCPVQGVDEGLAGREIDCHQVSHGS